MRNTMHTTWHASRGERLGCADASRLFVVANCRQLGACRGLCTIVSEIPQVDPRIPVSNQWPGGVS